MTFDELKQINENKLEMYKKEYDNFKEEGIKKEILIHEKIKKLLENNSDIFFKIPMEEALKILSELVSEQNLKDTYTSLIDPEKYKELRRKFEV